MITLYKFASPYLAEIDPLFWEKKFYNGLTWPIFVRFGSNLVQSRGVYSQEFVANEVKKSWSWSYKLIFLVILHIQIEEFNYRLLIMLK